MFKDFMELVFIMVGITFIAYLLGLVGEYFDKRRMDREALMSHEEYKKLCAARSRPSVWEAWKTTNIGLSPTTYLALLARRRHWNPETPTDRRPSTLR